MLDEATGTITIPERVEEVGEGTFAGLKGLKKIIIPNGIKKMQGFLFQGAIALDTISLPASLEVIDNDCFYDASAILESINLNIDNQNFIVENGILLSKDKSQIYAVTKSSIKDNTFIVPNGIVYIGSGILMPFLNITKVIIPESVNQIESGFFPWSIEEIEINENNLNYVSINKQILSKDIKILYFCYSKEETITLEEGIEEIKSCTFSCRKKLTNIILPQSLKLIESSAFHKCSALSTITIPNSVEKMEGWGFFDECSNLKEIIVDKQYGSLAGSPWGCIYGDRVVKWLR
ncbi:MAG: leucine-rich repeat protein [Clostridia bacterium]|nr:leucine-rich repeat protein [Clostridia bacterium]